MAVKSALYVYRWFIPTVEIEEDHPTAFLIRQMSKRDIDAVQDKKQSTALLQMMSEYIGTAVIIGLGIVLTYYQAKWYEYDPDKDF